IERLSDLPGPLLLARGLLQIAPGKIDANRIAVDMTERLFDRNIQPATLHRHHELDLVMHVLGQGWIGNGGAVRLEHVGMLGKEERRIPFVVSHLANVLEIVAADAPDAAHGKGFGVPGYRERSLRRSGNDEGSRVHEKVSAGFKTEMAAVLRGCSGRG